MFVELALSKNELRRLQRHRLRLISLVLLPSVLFEVSILVVENVQTFSNSSPIHYVQNHPCFFAFGYKTFSRLSQKHYLVQAHTFMLRHQNKIELPE